ncbi:MAG: glycosyltransferase family 4 protein [Planctomycetota bacterium]|nr:MAG: glycosyltransferase family 4 protein [Planctomycetota bacterium]
MNVALIMERIETWRGGAETSTISFAGHLADSGCKVSILTCSAIPSTPTITVVPIGASGALRAVKTWLFSRRTARYIREHHFDIVHCITPCPVADVYQPRGGTLPEALERNLATRGNPLYRGIKRVFQTTSLKYRVVAALERRLLNRRYTPWVIAISQYVVDQLERHYNFDASRIRQIFNGVDPDLTPLGERKTRRTQIRRQFKLADDDLFVLCVAHNFKLKGVAKLIEALALLRARQRQDCQASGRRIYGVIVGRDNPTGYMKLAHHLGIADRIIFAGPTQRIHAFYHAADLLAHPTYYDPCSRVVLEAMAAGLPVITTGYNGAAERIKNGKQGYVIDSPMKVEALADGIDRLSDDKHRRECASNACTAVANITMKEHTQEVLSLYEEIIKSDGPKRGGYR